MWTRWSRSKPGLSVSLDAGEFHRFVCFRLQHLGLSPDGGTDRLFRAHDGCRRSAPAQPLRRREAAGNGFRGTSARPRDARRTSGGSDELLLEVRPSNTKALALYRHFGFQQIGVRRGYYPAEQGTGGCAGDETCPGEGARHDRQQPACDRLTRARLLHEIGLSPHWQLRESAWRRRRGRAQPGQLAEQRSAPQRSRGLRSAIPRRCPTAAASGRFCTPADGRARKRLPGWAGSSCAKALPPVARVRSARSRRQAVLGVGDVTADWLFIGEGPGAEEDARGEPFVGPAGKLLDAMLAAIDLQRGKRRLHRQRRQVPSAQQSHAGARRNRHLCALSETTDCADSAAADCPPGRAAAHALLGDVGSLASLRGQSFAYPRRPAARRRFRSSSPIIRPTCCAPCRTRQKPGRICAARAP
jgi:uracil-DNA glycosylase family 4